jgi:serine/threonine protein kinase
VSINENLPQEIRLFFQPRDKKEYYESLYSMESRLNQSNFWPSISQGLRELLLNMISEDPEKRIDLEAILTIPYFMDSNQLRLYSTLADELEAMPPREAKIFMSSLELIVKEGLTIEQSLMEEYFRPVLSSMVLYNSLEGKENDFLVALALSILIELDKPPVDAIYHGFRKAHTKNFAAVRLVLTKKAKLLQVLPTEYFDAVLSRALFSRYL